MQVHPLMIRYLTYDSLIAKLLRSAIDFPLDASTPPNTTLQFPSCRCETLTRNAQFFALCSIMPYDCRVDSFVIFQVAEIKCLMGRLSQEPASFGSRVAPRNRYTHKPA